MDETALTVILTSDLLDNVTHVLRDGLVTTVTPVLEDGLERTVLRYALWAGLVPTVTSVNSDSTQQATALNVSRMDSGLVKCSWSYL